MPDVSVLVISDLNATSAMPLRHCHIMHSRHRFDSRFFLLQPVPTMNPEMNLSIDRRGVFEDRRPIYIPIREDCPWVARNGEETRWTMKARQFRAVAQSELLLIFRERDDRFPGNVECLSRLHFPKVGSNKKKANHRFLRPKRRITKNPISTCFGVFSAPFCRA